MSELLKNLLSLSLGGGMMALLLLAVRLILGRRLPSAFYYYAWLAVLLRCLIPAPGLLRLERPALPVSPPTATTAPAAVPTPVTDLRPARQELNVELREVTLPVVQPQAAPAPQTLPQQPETPAAPAERSKQENPRLSLSAAQSVGLMWAAGALTCAGYFIIGYLRFSRSLNRTLRRCGAREWQLFRQLGGPKRLRLCRSQAVSTPMQLGILDARLVLPEREYSEDMLLNILRHELTHFTRHDIVYKWLTVGVCAIHWFNPVLWLARREIDRQCELSCDERLLKTMSPAQKQSYGETLLTLAADRAMPRTVVATSFATEKRNLKERLEHIMTYKRISWATIALILCTALVLVGCGAVAGPASPSAPVHATLPPETEPVLQSEPAPVMTEDGAVLVSTVDQLLSAIAPNTTIQLAPGSYDLSTASNYPVAQEPSTGPETVAGGEHYYWYNLVDGYGLYIDNVQNLTIRAEPGSETSILAVPRYADVLRFQSCNGITLENLTVGHTLEPSGCAGAVLLFDRTDNVKVTGCNLFGCGTWGILATNCENILANNTKIYDCSLGAVNVSECYNFQLDGSEIYGCRSMEGLISVSQSEEVAVTNSRVHDNIVSLLVNSQHNSRGVYIGGVDVRSNAFSNGLYSSRYKPIVFDNCRISGTNQIMGSFSGKSEYDYDESTNLVQAVDPSGQTLSDDAMREIKQQDVTWTAKERPVAQSPNAGEDGMIHVTNVDELVAAIAPNASIYLEPGTYDLSKASNYGQMGGDYYTWGQEFDGYSLVLTNVEGLSLTAAGPDQVTLAAVPRYADVLRFEGCRNITLKGFTAGHTPEKGSCAGDVLTFVNTTQVRVENCSLFGCGVHGINGEGCTNMDIVDTEIYDCEYDAVVLRDCYTVAFNNCNIHDNGSDTITVMGGTNITRDSVPVSNN